MTIQYSNGTEVEAVLLSRDGERMRVAASGGADALELVRHNGVWISEDCEPVRIRFAWQRPSRQEPVEEADCICSRELASRLIHLLLIGEGPSGQAQPSSAALSAGAYLAVKAATV